MISFKYINNDNLHKVGLKMSLAKVTSDTSLANYIETTAGCAMSVHPLLGILQHKIPAMSLSKSNGILLGSKVQQDVGDRVSSAGPPHWVVLPPLLVVKLSST